MNKKPGLLKKIVRFIDKKIVVPITKAIMKIGKRFNSSNISLENFLSKSNTLLFVSLFLALVVFILFDQKKISFNDTSAEVLKDQTVEAVYNEEAYVVEGLPEKVDITLMGSRSDLFIAKQSTASKVTVDLTGLKPGTHKVDIEYMRPNDAVDYSVNPSVATVNIYPKVSESKTLTTDLLNQDDLDPKLIIDNVTPEVDNVVIKGAEDENAINSLTKVATVKALVDVSSLNDQDVGTVTLKDVPLKAYDSDGNSLDVEIVPSKIEVEVDLSSPSKTVPIRAIPKGDVTFGQAISSINLSQNNVTVYGKQSVLDDLEYVPLEVDVDGLKENREYKLDLKKPKGVRSMSVNNVTVEVSLGTSADKDIPNVNIDVRNLDDRYSVQGLSQNDIQVTVSLKGVESVLNNLEEDDVTAYIDLKGYEPGEYEVDVHVSGTDSRVQYLSKTKKVKIRVVEK